ncbi:thiamine-phosphate kinase [Phenylobacterium sp.]|uniref:thiamine-phosphate kinase n=1 Tax=Phenylobacterium sp. TaxID=1871053 RepID=UPI00122195F4|nr:thiamine-phosphate kinase [Phenylobacterium sp.]THD62934.1 MAG: thiamine-phosphate kinase [Phenylobacterium sp.]
MSGGGEFSEIARLFRPLTGGAVGAFDLLDDAAIVPQRPGFDLVVTKDALVEGVHVPLGEAADLVARKLVRVNLSDLAAKAAEPFGVFLAVAWPPAYGVADREAFARGLGEDLRAFGVALLGGDTVGTPGPFTASLTALGWVPEGRMVRRAGARAGDVLAVSGTIGDGVLGLAAVRGELADPDGWLSGRYRLPNPRLDLRQALSGHAHAAADVSDGLIADAGHIAEASGTGLTLDLDALPLSPPARAWLGVQPDRTAALVRLATGGDDYEVAAAFPGPPPAGFTAIGEITAEPGVRVLAGGRTVEIAQAGWRHL